MLPGLQIFDLHEPSKCNVLNSIAADFEGGSAKSLSDYYSPGCTPECNGHHLVVYLENALHRGVPICYKDVSALILHESSKVRKISLMLHCKHFPDIPPPPSFQHDPDHLIRAIYLRQKGNIRILSLIKQARDGNKDVREAALHQLMRFSEDERYKTKILRAVCHGIHDRELSIRVFASKAIGEFKGLPDEMIGRLLSKQVTSPDDQELCGGLIYGIEDEYSDVRRNTISSVFSLITPGIASKAFDFIVDSLNDDDSDVRELCTLYLKKISMKYVLAVDKEIVRQISESLKERSCNVKTNILGLLGNLKYEDVEVFNILTSHMEVNVGPRDVFRCIGKIVSRNKKLFLANVDRFYKHTPMAQVEESLEDNLYVARLMVLREMKRADPEMRISKIIEDHFLFLDIMECSKPNGCGDGYIFFKDILCQFLEEPSVDKKGHYKRLFNQMKENDDDRYLFIYYVYKGMDELLRKKRDNILRKIQFLFVNTDFDISLISNIKLFIEYIKSLDFKSIRFLRYDVDVPSKVKVRSKMPIRFSACLTIESSHCDVHLKVWSENKQPIYYRAQKAIDICIFDDVSSICCSIVKLLPTQDIQLSHTKTVLIEKKKHKKDLIPGIDRY
ncbi:AP-1 complex subunit beta-1 [Encephalitozoon hellem]|uniref:AP-1 complex subunit beta-1 n=1 Tax=Encephalitozoon hellem TaxID=27973 RepID=A0ABY8CKN9_ENCHE|nr:AP-1 complex subunit beta-1 [Encephalitozoon hellem]